MLYAYKSTIIFYQNKHKNKYLKVMSLMYILRKTGFIMFLNGKSDSINIYFIWYIVLWGPFTKWGRFLTVLFPKKIYCLVIRIQIFVQFYNKILRSLSADISYVNFIILSRNYCFFWNWRQPLITFVVNDSIMLLTSMLRIIKVNQ